MEDVLVFLLLDGHLVVSKEYEHTFRRCGDRLHAYYRIRYLRKRAGEEFHIDHEGDDDTDGRVALHVQHRTDDAHQNICDVADQPAEMR